MYKANKHYSLKNYGNSIFVRSLNMAARKRINHIFKLQVYIDIHFIDEAFLLDKMNLERNLVLHFLE